MSTQAKGRTAVLRRIATYPELKPRYGIPFSYVHICRLEKAGRFPKKVRISANRVGWFEDELQQMLEERAAERDAEA
jgi:prophage regulatory protein